MALAGVPRAAAAAMAMAGLLGVRPGVAATAARDAASFSHQTWSSLTCRTHMKSSLRAVAQLSEACMYSHTRGSS
jgi:hypothetical protein